MKKILGLGFKFIIYFFWDALETFFKKFSFSQKLLYSFFLNGTNGKSAH